MAAGAVGRRLGGGWAGVCASNGRRLRFGDWAEVVTSEVVTSEVVTSAVVTSEVVTSEVVTSAVERRLCPVAK